MKTSLLFGGAFLLICVVGVEVGFVNGKVAALVLASSVLAALLFSFAKGIPKTEAVMASGEEDVIEGEGFGFKGKIKGPNVLTRSVGSPTLTNLLLCGIAAGLYLHDGSTTEALKRQAAAVEVANYLSTQSEERRQEIGKRMAEPDALRRLYR